MGKTYKEIEAMSSEDFIAHLFYNVLGGLHANEEIDARMGILDMIEDRESDREAKDSHLKLAVEALEKIKKMDASDEQWVIDEAWEAVDKALEEIRGSNQ